MSPYIRALRYQCMNTPMTRAASLLVALGLGAATPAAAQSLGTFTWQLQPFCNRVTVTVTQNGGIYTLDGFDDQCGAPQRAPLVGLATPNPDGTIGFGFHIVTVPGGAAVGVDARITLPALSGSWSDSAGNSGAFAFAAQTSGSPRPVPPATGLAPGSVTGVALAAGAVTTAAIADGTIGAADINTAEVQRRITGPCPVGTYMTSATASGVPTCSSGGTVVALGASAAAANAGVRNTAIGFQALQANVGGLDNTAIGSQALRSLNPTPSSGGNTAIGASAMFSATTGVWNTAIGGGALQRVQGGTANTAVGRLALQNVDSTSNNTALGNNAGFNTTGGSNIAIGADAGSQVTTGFSNIHIGHLGNAADDATIRIGTAGVQTRAFMAGVRGVTTATAAIPVLVGTDGQLGTVSSSRRFKQDIADMGDFSARLATLRPVTFRYTQPAADGSQPLDYGLIAEEVAEVFPELAVRSADGQIETVAYHKLPALLLNELQKQQRLIDTLLQRVQSLETARDRQ